MTHTGGLTKAIAARRAGWAAEQPSVVEKDLLCVLEGSVEARNAWRGLEEQPKGRWKVEVNSGEVLSLVVSSALISARHGEVRQLRDATEYLYSRLKGAAGLLFEHFVERSGLSSDALTQTDLLNPPNDDVAGARRCEWILDTLDVAEICDKMDIGNLPQQSLRRGPGAKARMFEHCLSVFLARAYDRPFGNFVLKVSAVLHPNTASTNEALLARSIRRERDGASRRKDELEKRLADADDLDAESESTDPSRYRNSELFSGKEARAASAAAANLRLLREPMQIIRPQRVTSRRR